MSVGIEDLKQTAHAHLVPADETRQDVGILNDVHVERIHADIEDSHLRLTTILADVDFIIEQPVRVCANGLRQCLQLVDGEAVFVLCWW